MTYNTDKILFLLERVGIGDYYQNFYADEYGEGDSEKFFDNLRSFSNFFKTYYVGATKMVLIPNTGDYVVKIPFYGSHNYYYNSNNNYYYYRQEDEYITFIGANNLYNDWDYCATEAERFEIATNNGWDFLFAKTVLIGYADDYPIYVQEKCQGLAEFNEKDKPSQNSRELAKAFMQQSHINLDLFWTATAIELFGDKKIFNFLHFLKDKNWNDLHSGNIGFLNKKPIIFDYAGYNE